MGWQWWQPSASQDNRDRKGFFYCDGETKCSWLPCVLLPLRTTTTTPTLPPPLPLPLHPSAAAPLPPSPQPLVSHGLPCHCCPRPLTSTLLRLLLKQYHPPNPNISPLSLLSLWNQRNYFFHFLSLFCDSVYSSAFTFFYLISRFFHHPPSPPPHPLSFVILSFLFSPHFERNRFSITCWVPRSFYIS